MKGCLLVVWRAELTPIYLIRTRKGERENTLLFPFRVLNCLEMREREREKKRERQIERDFIIMLELSMCQSGEREREKS